MAVFFGFFCIRECNKTGIFIVAGHNENSLRTNSSNNFELSKKMNRSCGDATHTSSGVK